MKLIVDHKIFEKFPEIAVGVLVCRNVDNLGNAQEIEEFITKETERIKKDFQPETLSQNPMIACWRKAYSAFGSKPSDYRSSIEALYKSVLKGRELRAINKLVDIYNYISLKYMLPLGGEDLNKISGDIRLTFAQNEKPMKLLGDENEEVPYDGEVIYKDDDSAICRRWNWREADRTKLTEETKNCVLVIEAVKNEFRPQLEQTLGELKELVFKYCGGESTVSMLDKDNLKTEL